jgi:hypothetical protein
MNTTNRALNRIGIFLLGLILLSAGAAVALASVLPEWLDRWMSVSATADSSTSDFLQSTQVDGRESWVLVALPAACVLLIVLLAVFIFRQGHGRTRALISQDATATAIPAAATPAAASKFGATKSSAAATKSRTTTPATVGSGTVTVDGKVAEQSIQDALAKHPGLLSSQVGTFLVKRTPTLRITANTRRGVSPKDVRTFIDEVVTAWDASLGREVPVLIQITSGITTRTARATRFDPRVASATPGSTPPVAAEPDRT